MGLGVGVGEEVVADAELLLRAQEALVIVLEDGFCGQAVPVGLDRDGRAMRIRAGDHEHVVAAQAMIAREDVRRQINAGQMAHVQVAVGVGPGDGYMDVLGSAAHGHSFQTRAMIAQTNGTPLTA